MDTRHERRLGKDRRQYALYYRYGTERREQGKPIISALMEEDEPTDLNRVIIQGYWGASEDDSTTE